MSARCKAWKQGTGDSKISKKSLPISQQFNDTKSNPGTGQMLKVYCMRESSTLWKALNPTAHVCVVTSCIFSKEGYGTCRYVNASTVMQNCPDNCSLRNSL